MADLVFRVTVRGRFGALPDDVRAYLVDAQAEHDIAMSAYTPEGTFVYDGKLDFFNLRYEVRARDADAAGASALREAETFLRTLRITHRGLKVTIVDMATMWDAAERRSRGRQP
jgi:hypothetical protein